MANHDIKLGYCVKDFLFEKYTFHFPNKFESSLIYWYFLPVGNAKYGLCGGMALSTILYYNYCLSTPSDVVSPSDKINPKLFNFIKKCQVDSLLSKDSFNYFKFMFQKENTTQNLSYGFKGLLGRA